MSSFKVIFCIAFGLLALSSTTEADCDICSSISYAACVNVSSFKICTDGKTASDKIETCGGNTVCTDTQGVCKPNAPGVVRGCEISSKCNDCSGTAPFTCVSQTQFAFCAAGKVGFTSTCENGKFCSLTEFASSGQMCGLSCVVEPTCQNTEPAAPPAGDWRESCLSSATTGYYINVHDTSCKTYVYCEEVNTVMNAVKYECGARYFDVVSERCVEEKPATCY